MATVQRHANGSLQVTLDYIEEQTLDFLNDNSFEQYITLWLAERGNRVISEKFAQLSGPDKADVMDKFSKLAQPHRPTQP